MVIDNERLFGMELPEILSTETSDFLKQIIFLKSYNSVLFCGKECYSVEKDEVRSQMADKL